MTNDTRQLIVFWRRLRTRFDAYRASDEAHPEFAWSVIIGLTVIGLLLAALFGTLIYHNGKTEISEASPSGGAEGIKISVADIESLVAFYDERRQEFERITSEKPIPPAFSQGVSVVGESEESGESPDTDLGGPVP